MSLLSRAEIASMNATLRQLTNATLIEISGPARRDAHGDPVGDGPVLWSGEARGFLQRENRVRVVNDREVVEDVDVLRIFEAEGAPTDVVAGADWEASTVLVEDHRPSTPIALRWQVRGMSWDHDGTLDSMLLELDAETEA